MLKVFLAGRVAIETDGVVMDERRFGGRQGRLLFAYLAAEEGRAVPRGELAEVLWGEQPPARWEKALSVLVSKLRVVLGESGIDSTRALTGAFGCYRLELPEGSWVDVLAAGSAMHEAEQALGVGALERAMAAASLAESLIGQPFLPGDDGTWIEEKRRELAEIRARSLSVLGDASLRSGAGREAAQWAEQEIALEPFRESGYRRLMQAHVAAGDRAEALRVYDRCRRLLADELGTYPSPETDSIYQALLEAPAPRRTARSQAPSPEMGDRGDAALELELASLRHDPTSSPPASAPASKAEGYLPAPMSGFLGRVRELAEVTALLGAGGTRLLTLTGAGGSGKTRLALAAAQACADAFPAGAWFVGFADLTDPGLIASVICQTLGLAEQPNVTPAQLLAGHLRDREQLLLLDNLEHLTPGVGVVGELLASCPGLMILATSREPLHLTGELQYEVPVLEPGDAVELFTARAGAVAPNLAVEREIVGAVCERLDRLPLAIELAAARTKVLSPAGILARLDRHLPVLATGPRDAPRRQRTLHATIDWSYDLLTEEQQLLFAGLSVFAGGCTLQAAEGVCDAGLDTLQALVERSLVRADGGRYWMLQTLREYGLEKLAHASEDDRLRARHAHWYVELLHSYGLDKSLDFDSGKMRVLLQDERENFRAALDWAEQAGEFETLARIAAPLARLWRGEGALGEATRWITIARERSDDYPLALQALVLSAAGDVADVRGAHEEWADLCEQSLAAYRELGDPPGIIRAISMRAGAAEELGDLQQARVMMEQAVALAREHDCTSWLPRTLGNLADLEIAEGRLGQARELSEEALSLGPSTDVVAQLELNLADIANLERRHDDATKLAQDALEAATASGSRIIGVSAALSLAWGLAERHHARRAALVLGAALEFHRHTGIAMQWSDTMCEQGARNALEAQLDETTLRALLDQGRNMTVEEAVGQHFEKTGAAWRPTSGDRDHADAR